MQCVMYITQVLCKSKNIALYPPPANVSTDMLSTQYLGSKARDIMTGETTFIVSTQALLEYLNKLNVEKIPG